jgi:hypothetical protein
VRREGEAEQQLLVASVTVVFGPDGGHAEPEAVAAGLLDHDEVSTVRINAHGSASGYRVDVMGPSLEEAAGHASALAAEVAARLDLRAEVLSVGLTRDDDRREVFRIGDRGDELVWGER